MVEFVVAAPVFFVLLIMSMEFAILGYRAAALHYTVSAATRWGVLGQTIGGNLRVASIKEKVREIGSKYGLALSDSNINVCQLGNLSCIPQSAGDPEEYIQVTANLPINILLGKYTVNLSASIMGRNEPYL